MYNLVVYEYASDKRMRKDCGLPVLFQRECKNKKALARSKQYISENFLGCNYAVYIGNKCLIGGAVDNMAV